MSEKTIDAVKTTNKISPLLYGIACVLICAFVLAFKDNLSKYLTMSYSALLLGWTRYLAQFIIMSVIFVPKIGTKIMQTQSIGLQILRGLSLTGVTFFILIGFTYLPVAESIATFYASPIFVTIIAVLVLKEHVSKIHWLYLLLAMFGVILIIRPGGELFNIHVLYPLASAACFAVYQIITRKIAQQDNIYTSNYYTCIVGTVALGIFIPLYWQTPTLIHFFIMMGLGALGMLAHLFLTKAFEFGPASILTPFTYIQIIFSGILGYIFFGHIPDPIGIVGMVLIVISGILIGRLQVK